MPRMVRPSSGSLGLGITIGTLLAQGRSLVPLDDHNRRPWDFCRVFDTGAIHGRGICCGVVISPSQERVGCGFMPASLLLAFSPHNSTAGKKNRASFNSQPAASAVHRPDPTNHASKEEGAKPQCGALTEGSLSYRKIFQSRVN